MNPVQPSSDGMMALLNKVRVVLVSPSHAGNVGSCARALKTMGLSQLWLVAPRRDGVLEDPEAVALASGATDVLAQARVVAQLPDALTGCTWVLATSSRERELAPPLLEAPSAVAGLVQRLHGLQPGQDVALVFGCERTGLSNEDLLRADVHAIIPANPDYASLNLSQAVQLLAWEVRRAVLYGAHLAPTGAVLPNQAPVALPDASRAVDVPAVERLFSHFLQAMEAVDFLNPEKPKRLVPRLRRLLQRAQLEREEVDLLHGFLGDVVRISQGRWYRAEWEALTQAVATARQRFGSQDSDPPPT